VKAAIFLMRIRHGDLDVFAVEQTQDAPRSYEQLSARAFPVEVLGVRLLVADSMDLIRMKSARLSSVTAPADPAQRQLEKPEGLGLGTRNAGRQERD
jgi:hypothetical protein